MKVLKMSNFFAKDSILDVWMGSEHVSGLFPWMNHTINQWMYHIMNEWMNEWITEWMNVSHNAI